MVEIFLDSYNNNEKREIIMQYYMKPKRKQNPDFDLTNLQTYYHHSNNCVDEITLIKLKDENDYFYLANGCAIFLAATEIFLEESQKQEFKNIEQLSLSFIKMINNEKMSDDEHQSLGKLLVFSNVKKHLNRVECALMITKVFEKVLESK